MSESGLLVSRLLRPRLDDLLGDVSLLHHPREAVGREELVPRNVLPKEEEGAAVQQGLQVDVNVAATVGGRAAKDLKVLKAKTYSPQKGKKEILPPLFRLRL